MRVSESYGNFSPPNASTAKAQLVSQATVTATAAAKSVLLTGGTEEAALKTAKVAANSVLNPTMSDAYTISSRSTTFMRRRKTRRQAKVVASVALMSATNEVDGSEENIEWDNTTISSHTRTGPYTNLSPAQMHHAQDDPSALTGATRHHQQTNYNHRPGFHARPPRTPQSRRKNEMAFFASQEGQQYVNPPPTQNEEYPHHTQRSAPGAHHRASDHVGTEDSTVACIPSRASLEFVEANDSMDTLDATTMPGLTNWSSLDPVLIALANTLSCAYCTRSDIPMDMRPRSSSRMREQRDSMSYDAHTAENNDDHDCDTLYTADIEEEFDARDDIETPDPRRASAAANDDVSTDPKEIRTGVLSAETSVSFSCSASDDSSEVLRELQSAASSEGEIQVRSSVRASMEKMVAKSARTQKRTMERDDAVKKNWVSYELREEAPVADTPTQNTIPDHSTRSFHGHKLPRLFGKSRTKPRQQAD